jgi:uncharacterized protein (DUF2141 family)
MTPGRSARRTPALEPALEPALCHSERAIKGRRICTRKLLLGLALAWIAVLPAQAANLVLTIEGVRSNVGEILIGVYDTADGFKRAIDSSATKSALLPQAWRIVGASLRAKAGSQSIVFTQLPPGRYAVIVFHDENDKGLLDANAFGIPVEAYGFSNNAQGLLGAPSFDAAAVEIGAEDRNVSISLIYPPSPSEEDEGDLRELGK